MYFETMEIMFQKIPVELPKPLNNKGKRQALLHAIGGDWHIKKLNENLPPLKKWKLKKNQKKKRTKSK